MRCKVGDLAVIVAPKHAINMGLIVRVVCPSNSNNFKIGEVYTEIDGQKYHRSNHSFFWYVESAGANILYDYGREVKSGPCSDNSLRPIRDNPGQDETLIWQPHKETA